MTFRTVWRPFIRKELKAAADAAEEASNSPALVFTARAGFAVSGVLHILIGTIGIQLARGQGGEADVGGAVAQLARQPSGPWLLWTCVVACLALALWQGSNAVLGYRHVQARGIRRKLYAAGQAIVFAAMAVTLMSFALGSGHNSRESTSDLTVAAAKAPLGPALLLVIGAVVIVVGAVFVVRGFSASFKKDLWLPASKPARSVLLALGACGYVAKGIALFLVGLLVIIATAQSRPEESTGLDGGLKALREQPYGPYLVAVVAVGLISYGLFLLAKAKTARM